MKYFLDVTEISNLLEDTDVIISIWIFNTMLVIPERQHVLG